MEIKSVTYDIVPNEYSKQEKQSAWSTAIGLNQVDGLYPSKYLIELKGKNIDGELSYEELTQELYKYYENQDFTNEEIRNAHECDLVSTRISELLLDKSFVFSPITLKTIHRHLFDGFDGFHAGEFRTVNITKKEPILSGKTVTYGDYSSLMDYLTYDFEQEKNTDYSILTEGKKIEKLADFTSSIWQVHPFIEGNTRTTAVFIEKYLRNKGYSVNNELFENNSVYFRNALVLANYSDIKNGVYEEKKYLISFFNKLLKERDSALLDIIT